MTKISVIIPSFNSERWIFETINSIISQQTEDTEIIVVDDGSTDGSSNIIATSFPQIQLIRTPNLGPSHARNIGTEIAKGEFIKYMDADDLMSPNNTFQRELNCLIETNGDMVYGDWQKLREQSNGTYQSGETITRRIEDNAEYEFFAGNFWMPLHTCLFRSKSLKKIKWNEHLKIVQDSRFYIDYASNSSRIIYQPGTVSLYRIHQGESVSRRSFKQVELDRLRNALDLKKQWSENMTFLRKEALLIVFSRIAFSFAFSHFDWSKTQISLAAIHEIDPHYRFKEGPSKWVLLSHKIGLKPALLLGYYYHKARVQLGGKVYQGPPIG